MCADTDMKRCTKCGNEYPRTAEYFHRASVKDSKDGLKPRCKQCRLEDLHCQRTAGERREKVFIPAASCHPVSPADLLRLTAMIRRLHYGDCLACGDWTLERQCCQHISDAEDDHAPDGTLIRGTYVEYLLYWQDCLAGVFDVRAEKNAARISAIHRDIAVYLCQHGWTAQSTRRVEYGAITAPNISLSRAYRLLKAQRSTVQSMQT